MAHLPSVMRACDACGVTYRVFQSRLAAGRNLHCSPSCAQRHRYDRLNAAFVDRFWPSLDGYPEPARCWLWTGSTNADGYGITRLHKRRTLAHRAAWMATHGEPPKDSVVCHRCDVRRCCNPSHLFLGTHADNVADMVAKGRNNAPRGAAHPRAKLTAEQVAEIMRRETTAAVLARRFGVRHQSITRYWKRRRES